MWIIPGDTIPEILVGVIHKPSSMKFDSESDFPGFDFIYFPLCKPYLLYNHILE